MTDSPDDNVMRQVHVSCFDKLLSKACVGSDPKLYQHSSAQLNQNQKYFIMYWEFTDCPPLYYVVQHFGQ